MLSSITVALGSLYICGVNRKDRPYVCLPLYHVSGGLMGMGFSIIFGSTVVLAKRFSAANYWTDCIKYQCTVDVKVVLSNLSNFLSYRFPRSFLSTTTTTTRLGNFFFFR